MIVCTQCGHHNVEADDFCGSCGDFLEWTGEALPTESAADAPRSGPASSEPGRGFVATVKALVGIEPETTTTAADGDERSVVPAQPGPPSGVDPQADERAVPDRQGLEAASAAAHAAHQRERAAAEAAERAIAEKSVAEKVSTQPAEAGSWAAPEQASQQDDPGPTQARRQAEAVAAARERADAQAQQQAQAATRAQQEAIRAAQAEERARSEAAARARAAAALVAKAAPPRTVESAGPAAGSTDSAGTDPSGTPAPVRPVGPPTLSRPGKARSVPPRKRPGVPASADPEAAALQPHAVKPARQVKARLPVAHQAPSRRLRPGDLICGACGEGNDPDRKFCRRCGASLEQAVVAKNAWWRRLFRRHRRSVAAGTRRKRRGGPGRFVGKVMRALLLLGLLALILLAVIPWTNPIGTFRKEMIDKFRNRAGAAYEKVQPVSASATTAITPMDALIDGRFDRTWEAPPDSRPGAQQILTLTYPGATDIERVTISSGPTESSEGFTAHARPKQIRVVFSDGTALDQTLTDTPEPQSFSAKARQVTQLRIQIVSVYPGAPTNGLSIAEIETFRSR